MSGRCSPGGERGIGKNGEAQSSWITDLIIYEYQRKKAIKTQCMSPNNPP